MRALLLSVVAASALCAVLAGQKRIPVAGIAETADGEPWPGAFVHLVSHPVPFDERVGESDILAVRCDKRGRFRALLLPGRGYTAWALEEGKASYRISDPVENVTGASPLSIRARAKPRPYVAVKVKGLAAWSDRGPLIVRAMSDTRNRHVAPCEVTGDNLVRIPPLPGLSGRMEILCGDRPLLPWPVAINLTRDDSTGIRPPKRVLLRVVQQGTNKPIKGATVSATNLVMRARAHPLGRTDDDGFVIVELPVGGESALNWGGYPILVQARGFAPVGSIPTFKVPPSHDADAARKSSEPIVSIAMSPGTRLQGRIVLRGEGVPDLQLHVANQIRGFAMGNRGTSRRRSSMSLTTDKNGAFALDTDPRSSLVLAAVPTAQQAKVLGAAACCPLWIVATVPANGDSDLGTIDLVKWKPTRIQVISPQRAPADSSVRIAFCSIAGNLLADPMNLDRVGKIVTLLPRGRTLYACVWSRHGFAVQKVDSGTDVRISMTGCATVTGRANWKKDGTAARGVLVRAHLSSAVPELRAFGNAVSPSAMTGSKGQFVMAQYPGIRYRFWRIEAQRGTEYLANDVGFVGGTEPLTDLRLVIR